MDIINIASIVTALTVIIGCIVKLYRLARRLEDRLESYDKNLEQLNLHLNKMALLDVNLPLIDRLRAGECYIAHGGNGLGKKVYNQLLEEIDTSAWGNETWAESQQKKGDING